MKPCNKRMRDFLASHGIKADVKYIAEGSLKGSWRLWGGLDSEWTDELREKLTALGFADFDGKPLNRYSGNGGRFSVFVRGHNELLED